MRLLVCTERRKERKRASERTSSKQKKYNERCSLGAADLSAHTESEHKTQAIQENGGATGKPILSILIS